jgi:hypothetical protein
MAALSINQWMVKEWRANIKRHKRKDKEAQCPKLSNIVRNISIYAMF